MPPLEAAMRDARASGHGVTIVGSGVLRHAAAASASAKHEITTIGSISLVGVLLVFLVCFRSLRPLLLVFLSLGAASVVSLATVATRSEERRGGKECVSTCRYRGSPYP